MNRTGGFGNTGIKGFWQMVISDERPKIKGKIKWDWDWRIIVFWCWCIYNFTRIHQKKNPTNETSTTAAERHWTIGKKTADLNQPMHYKDALPSAWRQGKVSQWGRGYAYFPWEIISNRLLLILPKLIKIKHEQETSCRPLQLSLQKMRHRRPLDQTTNHPPPPGTA